jgi:hypothetical protein
MSEPSCRTCGANPPAVSGMCAPCWTDHLAEAEAQRKAQERARIAASRCGRPSWRPDTSGRNHGHGTERMR